jgi:hypothetical protein
MSNSNVESISLALASLLASYVSENPEALEKIRATEEGSSFPLPLDPGLVALAGQQLLEMGRQSVGMGEFTHRSEVHLPVPVGEHAREASLQALAVGHLATRYLAGNPGQLEAFVQHVKETDPDPTGGPVLLGKEMTEQAAEILDQMATVLMAAGDHMAKHHDPRPEPGPEPVSDDGHRS